MTEQEQQTNLPVATEQRQLAPAQVSMAQIREAATRDFLIDVAEMANRVQKNQLVMEALDKDVDFFEFEDDRGRKHKSLGQSGAEKVSFLHGWAARYTKIDETMDRGERPFYAVEYQCDLYTIGTNLFIGSAGGSANSEEAVHRRRRWIPESKATSEDKKNALDSKTEEDVEWIPTWKLTDEEKKQAKGHRMQQKKAGGEFKMYKMVRLVTKYLVDDTMSAVHSIQMKARKRAFVAANRRAACMSGAISQDLEDAPGSYGMKTPGRGASEAQEPPPEQGKAPRNVTPAAEDKAKTKKLAPASSDGGNGSKKVGVKELKTLYATANDFDMSNDALKEVLRPFNYTKFDDVLLKDYDKVLKAVGDAGLEAKTGGEK